MADPIDRQAAIEIIKNYCENGCDIAEYKWCPSCQQEQFIKLLKALPSAQSEPHWIPCSERLPEDFGEYLVTKKAIGWNCEEYNSNDIAYFDNEGFHKADKVLAWMPLPEPYRGEGDT